MLHTHFLFFLPLNTRETVCSTFGPSVVAKHVNKELLVIFTISRVEVKKKWSLSGSSSSILPVRVALNWSSELFRNDPTELPPVKSGRESPEGNVHVSVKVGIRV